MINFDKDKVIALHKLTAQKTGGDDGLRDSALLDSAIQSVYATFDGNELYPSIEEKAARLCFNLISNHAFVDGNKRIGVLVALIFLEVNGISIFTTNDDVVSLGLGVASGKMKYDDVLNWIKHNE